MHCAKGPFLGRNSKSKKGGGSALLHPNAQVGVVLSSDGRKPPLPGHVWRNPARIACACRLGAAF